MITKKELDKIKSLISELRDTISDIIVYICAYGKAITNFKGEELLYADTLYLYTKANIKYSTLPAEIFKQCLNE